MRCCRFSFCLVSTAFFYNLILHWGKIKKYRAKSKSTKAKTNCIKDSVYIEPMVTQEEFERALCHAQGHSTARKYDKHPLVGKLCCGGCGYAMVYKPASHYNKYRRLECYRHSVLKIPECCIDSSAELLEELVLSMVNKELMLRGEAVRQAGGVAEFLKSGIEDAKHSLRELCTKKRKQRILSVRCM